MEKPILLRVGIELLGILEDIAKELGAKLIPTKSVCKCPICNVKHLSA